MNKSLFCFLFGLAFSSTPVAAQICFDPYRNIYYNCDEYYYRNDQPTVYYTAPMGGTYYDNDNQVNENRRVYHRENRRYRGDNREWTGESRHYRQWHGRYGKSWGAGSRY